MDTGKRRTRSVVEAAAWRMHLAGTDVDTSPEFEQWLSADPGHKTAWRGVQAPWELLAQQANSPEALEWRRMALSDARATSRQRARSAGPRAWRQYGMAAGVAILAATALAWWWAGSPDAYRTGVGEQRVVVLGDGSRLTLDAETDVRVSYSDAHRDLKLLRGQARFDVARDVERPFTVHAHGQKIIALGTAFNVDRLGTRTLVTLIEGRVAVVSAASTGGVELKPGEQLIANDGGGAPAVKAVDLELMTAWQSGQLAFNNEPLAAVVERMNRYATPHLEVGDPRAGALGVSGVFRAGDVDGFVKTVTEYLPVRAEAGHSGTVVLRSR